MYISAAQKLRNCPATGAPPAPPPRPAPRPRAVAGGRRRGSQCRSSRGEHRSPRAELRRASLCICASPKQAEHDGGVAMEGGVHQRGAAVAVLLVDLSAVPQQQLDHPFVAVVGGEHQRGVAAAALKVDLRAVPYQQLDHPLATFVGGGHQRGVAVANLQIDLRAVSGFGLARASSAMSVI